MNSDQLLDSNPLISPIDRTDPIWDAFCGFMLEAQEDGSSVVSGVMEAFSSDLTLAQIATSYMWSAFQAGFDTASD